MLSLGYRYDNDMCFLCPFIRCKMYNVLQLNAIHAARLQAGSGKVYVPKPQQFGRLRKKSEFSRMQALFGHHFKTVLLPKALSALEAKINEGFSLLSIALSVIHAWSPFFSDAAWLWPGSLPLLLYQTLPSWILLGIWNELVCFFAKFLSLYFLCSEAFE